MTMREYKATYEVARGYYDQFWSLLKKARYSNGEDLSRSDIAKMASALATWTTYIFDLECDRVSIALSEVFGKIYGIVDIYLDEIDTLFVDLKKLTSAVLSTDPIRVCGYETKFENGRIWCLHHVISHSFFGKTDVESVRIKRAAFNFIAKLNLDRPTLAVKNEWEYLDHEDYLRSLAPPDERALRPVRKWFQRFTKGFDANQILKGLQLSSGATAETTSDLVEKMRRFPGLTERIKEAIEVTLCWSGVDPEFMEFLDWPIVEDVPSKVCFVPKTALTYRVIAEESVVRNFWQNGVSRALVNARGWPRHLVRLEDQTHSMKMCIEASKDGHLATIDLSKASDSIRTSVIEYLCWNENEERTSEVGLLREWLLATRPEAVSLEDPWDGELVVQIAKYASMGTVTTFPLLSEVMVSAGCAALEDVGIQPSSETLSVYGDDIVIAVEAVERLFYYLELLGLSVNRDKSFYDEGPCFREACGAFGYRGKDITMPAISRKSFNLFDSSGAGSYDRALAAAQMANEMFFANCNLTRYICIRYVIGCGVQFLTRPPTWEEWKPFYLKKVRGPDYSREPVTAPILIYRNPSDWIPEENLSMVEPANHNREARFHDGPQPYTIKLFSFKRVRVIKKGEGFKLSVRSTVVAPDKRWSDEDRLSIWLYRSQFEERKSITPWDFSSLKEPLVVGFGNTASCKKATLKRILLSTSNYRVVV